VGVYVWVSGETTGDEEAEEWGRAGEGEIGGASQAQTASNEW
jgi:hypothetical protein